MPELSLQEDNADHHRYTSGRRDWSAFHSLQPAPVVEGVSACRDVPLPRRIAERIEAPMLPLNHQSMQIGIALERSGRDTQCGRGLARWQPVLHRFPQISTGASCLEPDLSSGVFNQARERFLSTWRSGITPRDLGARGALLQQQRHPLARLRPGLTRPKMRPFLRPLMPGAPKTRNPPERKARREEES